MRFDEISRLMEDNASQQERKRANHAQLITSELRKQGLTDPNYIKAVIATAMKETGPDLAPRSENFYYKSKSSDELRQNFSALRGMSDTDIEKLKTLSKSDPSQFANIVYAPGTKIGSRLGNVEPDDGWKFRGRGYIQLTGRGSYTEASKAIFGDDRLVKNPDLLLDPSIAAKTSAWRVKSDHERWAKELGIDTKKPLAQADAIRLAGAQVAGSDIQKAKPNTILGQGWTKLQQNIGLVKDDYLKDPTGGDVATNVPVSDPGTVAKIEPIPDIVKRPSLTVVPDTPLVNVDTKPSAGEIPVTKTKISTAGLSAQDEKDLLSSLGTAKPVSPAKSAGAISKEMPEPGISFGNERLGEAVNVSLRDVFDDLRRAFRR